MRRLIAVPWEALGSVADALEQPLHDVLAGSAAERVLDRLLRSNKAWSGEQRAVVAESIFGVGLWRRRIDAQLGRADAPMIDRVRCLIRDARGELPVPQAFADRWSLPDWLAEVIVVELGDQAEAFAEALCEPGPICLRANAARISREALAASLGFSTRPGLASHSLIVTAPRPNLYGLKQFAEGLFEVQDDGSQLLGEQLQAEAGDEVLDLCAGAGGKTLQLSCTVGPKGRVHAYDVDPVRLERLRQRAEKARATNIVVHHQLPESLRVKRALVDAPCSELGVLRRGPDVRWRIDPSQLDVWVPTQSKLIEQARRHLVAEGRLVYATCTIRREENDAVADAAGLTERFRVWPHLQGTDAFFAAASNLG